jgi:murein DD-endopeptidase MepM/ murein hydrolase activator NlpD
MPRRLAPLLVLSAIALATVAAADEDDELEGFEDVGCDSAAGGELDVEELVEDLPEDRTIPTALPTEWRESHGRQCQRYHGRRVCDGPRRVPVPHGPAAELAQALGLDAETRVAHALMQGPPRPEWVQAVEGAPTAGLLWPVPEGRLWRGFGMHRQVTRRHGRRPRRRHMHNGVDIGAAAGTPMRAVNDGLVAYSNNGMRGYGNSVVLLHADGTITLYAHCRATYVFAGERVRRGQVIAEVGETGITHGAHLHFEWRRDGQPLDPLPHFVDRPDDPPAEDPPVLADGPRAP